MNPNEMRARTRELYALLPAIHRVRDVDRKLALAELMDIVAEQVLVLEEDLAQLYDDQFIETCADWVVPYIGDLIGHRAVRGVSDRIATPRAEVANTIGYRRRKGTASVLEQLARDVTGWPAHAVEFFQVLATTQYMNHLRPRAPGTASLRGAIHVELPGTAFARQPRRIDVRALKNGGRYNIPAIGIFVWRLQSNPLELAPASRVDGRRYLFSRLDCDLPLFTRFDDEQEIETLSRPIEVPLPISRRRLDAAMKDPARRAEYYGADRSLHVLRDGVAVPPEELCICNLEDSGAGWAHMPDDGRVAVDPERGRIAFPSDVAAPANVTVTYHYGSVADIGGGAYPRPASALAAADTPPVVRKVPADFPTIQQALDSLPAAGGVVEVTDNRRYTEALNINAAADASIELRAQVGVWPQIVLTEDFAIAGTDTSSVTLDGFLVQSDPAAAVNSPGRILVGGALGSLTIAHCTLVPGHRLNRDGTPLRPGEPSLLADVPTARLRIHRSILGPVRLATDTALEATDSAIDATAPDRVAIAGLDAADAGGRLSLTACTLVGKVRASAMVLVSDCIFDARLAETGDDWMGPVLCDRKQEGCVRFSYVPLRSITPRRFRCQPELEIAAEIERREQGLSAPLGNSARERIRANVAAWLVPAFTSARFGAPAYLQLRDACRLQIRAGASDESEMGVYHLLFQPQRAANLRERLDEYVRFGMEAGLIHAN
jgi:hypothetical protein